MNINEEYLKNEQVTEILGISHRTLQTYRDKSMISYIKIGKTIRYAKSDIDIFLKDNRKEKKEKVW